MDGLPVFRIDGYRNCFNYSELSIRQSGDSQPGEVTPYGVSNYGPDSHRDRLDVVRKEQNDGLQ